MSARESDSAADASGSGPPFAVADWGYERYLVDLRVAELVQQVAQARRRGDQAEQALSKLQRDSHTGRLQVWGALPLRWTWCSSGLG